MVGMLLVAGVAACDSTMTPVQGISGGGGTTTTAAVTIGDNFFSPVQDTVGVGGTVTWTWTGVNKHQITFDDGAPGSDTLTTAPSAGRSVLPARSPTSMGCSAGRS